MSEGVVVVAKFRYEHEAALAAATLEAAGIDSEMFNITSPIVTPLLNLTQVRLAVREEDAERAREILNSPPLAASEEPND